MPTLKLSNCILKYIPTEMYMLTHQKNMFKNFHTNTVCNSPKLEVTQMYVSNRTYIDGGIYRYHLWEWTKRPYIQRVWILRELDEQEKTDMIKYILYYIYITFKNMENSSTVMDVKMGIA